MFEKCSKGSVVKAANRMLEHCTPKVAEETIRENDGKGYLL
jgi:predicted helicase